MKVNVKVAPIRTVYMSANHRPSVSEAANHRECWFSSESGAIGASYGCVGIRRGYRVYEVKVRQVVTAVRLTKSELQRERRRASAERKQRAKGAKRR